jgi:hypothetical protein
MKSRLLRHRDKRPISDALKSSPAQGDVPPQMGPRTMTRSISFPRNGQGLPHDEALYEQAHSQGIRALDLCDLGDLRWRDDSLLPTIDEECEYPGSLFRRMMLRRGRGSISATARPRLHLESRTAPYEGLETACRDASARDGDVPQALKSRSARGDVPRSRLERSTPHQRKRSANHETQGFLCKSIEEARRDTTEVLDAVLEDHPTSRLVHSHSCPALFRVRPADREQAHLMMHSETARRDAFARNGDVLDAVCEVIHEDVPTSRLEHSRSCPALSRVWAANREVRGLLQMRSSLDQDQSLKALCIIKDGKLSIQVEASAGEGIQSDSFLVDISIRHVEVTLRPKMCNMFIFSSTILQNDYVFCNTEDQVARNKWVAVFRRLGVRIFGEFEPGQRTLAYG